MIEAIRAYEANTRQNEAAVKAYEARIQRVDMSDPCFVAFVGGADAYNEWLNEDGTNFGYLGHADLWDRYQKWKAGDE